MPRRYARILLLIVLASLLIARTPVAAATTMRGPAPAVDTNCADGSFVPEAMPYFQQGRLARIGNGRVYGLDWSRDGSKIAVAAETGAYILDAASLRTLQYIDTGHAIEVVRFRPDGAMLATDEGDQVALWDVKSGERIGLIGNDIWFYASSWSQPSAAEMGDISFSPDGSSIVLHTNEYIGGETFPGVEVWDVRTYLLTIVRRWKVDGTGDDNSFPNPSFSHDGRLVVSPWQNGVVIWNIEAGHIIRTFVDRNAYAFFSPDDNKIVTQNKNKVELIDVNSGESMLLDPNDFEGSDTAAMFSADGEKVITLYATLEETQIDTWATATGKHTLTLPLQIYVNAFAVNPARNEIVTVGWDQKLQVWDLESGAMIRSRVFSAYLGSEVYPTPDGKSLLVMRDQRYHVYDARTGAYRCVLPGKAGENSFTSFSPDGNLFAAISDAGEAIVWNLQTAQVIETRVAGADRHPPTGRGPLVYQRFSLGDAGQDILAWAWVDADSGQRSWIRNRCDVYRSLPTDCPGAISADGKRILVPQPDRSFAIYDLSSQTVLNTLNLSSNNLAFTPDGRSVVSLRFLDWGVEIWDAQSGKLLERINRGLEGEGPILDIQEFSFSGDGEKLVTVLPYWGDSVRVWNTRTWQLERSLSTSSTVWDAKISGNGELISALSGYVLYLWQEEAQ